jgi:hypothetical protein
MMTVGRHVEGGITLHQHVQHCGARVVGMLLMVVVMMMFVVMVAQSEADL